MKRFSILFSILLGFALALAACGNGGPTTNLRVDMVEFMFEPFDYIIPAGQEITLELSNNGAVEHEFVIMKLGTEVGDDFGDEDEANIYWEAELEPGTSGAYTFTAPSEPGEYQIVCGTPGHYLAGMVGSLTVVAE
ncbi:MAG: cupredoxin domain-containing protein [Anaerolineales bacterium]|nr:cupredoxin domain-containing protein [Anaerolineales bacterium]